MSMKKGSGRIRFVLEIIVDSIVPLSIMLITYAYSLAATKFDIGTDLTTQVVLIVGGVSSIATYSYLVVSDFKSFKLEKDTEYEILKINSEREILLQSKEFEAIQKKYNISETSKDISYFDVEENHDSKNEKSAPERTVDLIFQVASEYAKNMDVELSIDQLTLYEAIITAKDRLTKLDTTKVPSKTKDAAYLTYWLSRMQPFRKHHSKRISTPETEKIDYRLINETLSVLVGLSLSGIEQGVFHAGKQEMERIIYQLRYGDISAEALALIYECFAKAAKNA